MTRRLVRHASPGPKNSLAYWTSYVSPLRVCFNFAIIYFCRFMPSLMLKNILLRLTGMKIGRDVSVGLMAMFDVFFPQLITIRDNSIIGYNSIILAHEFLVDGWNTGEVEIGPSAMIGANATILPGVIIGEGAIVSAASLVNKDVEPHTTAGGVPAKIINGS